MTTKFVEHPAFDKDCSEVLVATTPTIMTAMPGVAEYFTTKTQGYVLQQYDRFPAPTVTFTSVNIFYGETKKDLDAIYEGNIDHTCSTCAEGRKMAENILAMNDDMTVVVAIVKYVEHWPDLSMDIEVKTPEEAAE